MPRPATVISLCLALLMVLSLRTPFNTLIPRAHAVTDNILLVGNLSGWNFTGIDGNPPMTVSQGDNVSLLLGSDDVTHRFLFDADNETKFAVSCPPDQCSNLIIYPNTIRYSFLANFPPGKYKYYCAIHPLPMNGTFTIQPSTSHDLAVSKITVSRNSAYNSVTANPIPINVTTQNLGGFKESFTVYAWANSSLIQSATVTLAAGGTMVVTLNWTNTGLYARGTYTIKANVTHVSGETNFTNNQLVYGTFTVRLKGDVSGDCKVDIVDLATVGTQFGKTTATLGFNYNADLNNDGQVNIVDLVLVASAFGQHC